MPYLSEFDNRLVVDADGEPVGKVIDIIATFRGEMKHPELVALVIKRGEEKLNVPLTEVLVFFAPSISLIHRVEELSPYLPGERDFNLISDVLDRQIIDVDGVRVVRVNDLELVRINDRYYASNVDIGSLGLLRRLGLARAAQKISERLKLSLKPGIISWDDVELLPDEGPMRLKVPSSKTQDLHPADIAEILSDLNRLEGSRLLESLDVETVADALEEVEPDFQASLVETMSNEKVADILEEMAPDEAADLLAELPEPRSAALLNLMEAEEAKDVRRLLTYEEDTAGGIMTTEYAVVPPQLTAEQAICYLREHAGEAETIFYVYVTDKTGRLMGVFSLSDLILSQPQTPVSEFMHTRTVSVKLDDSQEEVARRVAKYNLLAVPVVDEYDRLQGIVTADDALDKIIPTSWKKRIPRIYR